MVNSHFLRKPADCLPRLGMEDDRPHHPTVSNLGHQGRALARPKPCVPLLLNAAITLRAGSFQPERIGLGASVGLLAGFAVLFVAMRVRREEVAGGGVRSY